MTREICLNSSAAPNLEPSDVSETRAVALLILLGAGLRVLSFFYSANTGGDAWARAALTAEWLRHPTFKIVFDAYPPGHFWLIGLSTLIFRDVVFAGRFLSLVLGIASLYFLWRLTRNLYGRGSALFALAVFSTYSLHIGYSTTSSAEVPYLFFLLCGLATFFDYFRRALRPLHLLVLSGLCFSAAEAIRLEAWVIFFALGIAFALLQYQDCRSESPWFQQWFKPTLVFAVTGGAWPLFSMIYSLAVFHDAMPVLSQHNALVTGWFKSHPVPLFYQLAVFSGALLISLSPLVVVTAIWGFLSSWKTRLGATFAALALFFSAVQIYEIAAGKLLAMARYTLTLGTMLAVLAGYGFEQITVKFFSRYRILVYASVIALLVMNLSVVLFLSEHPSRLSDKMASVSPKLRYPATIASVGEFLRQRIRADDALVIDNYNEESNVVAQAAGLPLLPGKRAFLANTRNEVSIEQYIAAQRPIFLVYSDQGTLHTSLPISPGCGVETINGIIFRCAFANRIYKVYELSYQ
jgi:4-amino-4-deoxy-L-arabinose transferase-like glycosyltransferase